MIDQFCLNCEKEGHKVIKTIKVPAGNEQVEITTEVCKNCGAYALKPEHRDLLNAVTNESDFKLFQSKLPELLKEHRGQHVLVKDGAFHGFYPSHTDALIAGLEKFGVVDFLIQEITDVIGTSHPMP